MRVCIYEAKRLIARAVLSTMIPTGHVLSVVMETLYAAPIEGVVVSNGFEGLVEFNYKGIIHPRLVNIISPSVNTTNNTIIMAIFNINFLCILQFKIWSFDTSKQCEDPFQLCQLLERFR